MKNSETGKIGENMANDYLIKKGYLILARNYKVRFGEIDIIARDNNGETVFCEVKTINNDSGLSHQFMPEDNLSPMKLKKMATAASLFLTYYPKVLKEGRGWRMDLIAIVLHGGAPIYFRHYENL